MVTIACRDVTSGLTRHAVMLLAVESVLLHAVVSAFESVNGSLVTANRQQKPTDCPAMKCFLKC